MKYILTQSKDEGCIFARFAILQFIDHNQCDQKNIAKIAQKWYH